MVPQFSWELGLRKRFSGLSELLSALILLGISIAVAFLLVYALPTVSPPEVKPWLRPTLIAAIRSGSTVKIYLYNPHSEAITVLQAWTGGGSQPVGVVIEPRKYAEVEVTVGSSETSLLLRFDTGAWMEVRFS